MWNVKFGTQIGTGLTIWWGIQNQKPKNIPFRYFVQFFKLSQFYPFRSKMLIFGSESRSNQKFDSIFKINKPMDPTLDTVVNFSDLVNTAYSGSEMWIFKLRSSPYHKLINDLRKKIIIIIDTLFTCLFSRFQSWWNIQASFLGKENFSKEKLDVIWKRFSSRDNPISRSQERKKKKVGEFVKCLYIIRNNYATKIWVNRDHSVILQKLIKI